MGLGDRVEQVGGREAREEDAEPGEDDGGAVRETEDAGGEEGEQVEDEGEPDGELDGVGAEAKRAVEAQVALEPAKEALDLPAPAVVVHHLGGAQVPAVGAQEVALGRGAPPVRARRSSRAPPTWSTAGC